jgi:hypothetical protein
MDGDAVGSRPHVMVSGMAYCYEDIIGQIESINNPQEIKGDNKNRPNDRKQYYAPTNTNLPKFSDSQWENSGLRRWDNVEFSDAEKNQIVQLVHDNHTSGDPVLRYYFQTHSPLNRFVYTTNSTQSFRAPQANRKRNLLKNILARGRLQPTRTVRNGSGGSRRRTVRKSRSQRRR